MDIEPIQKRKGKEMNNFVAKHANRCGVGLVPTIDVMHSHKDISGIGFPCHGQVKSDSIVVRTMYEQKVGKNAHTN